MPWGVRTDGESLWAIRRNGWLELGFHPDYFRQALGRVGLVAEVHTSADLPWINVWDAKVGVFEAPRPPRSNVALTTQPAPQKENVMAAQNTPSRLGGGGVLILAKRVLAKSLDRTMPVLMRYPKLMTLARGLLKPFRRLRRTFISSRQRQTLRLLCRTVPSKAHSSWIPIIVFWYAIQTNMECGASAIC